MLQNRAQQKLFGLAEHNPGALYSKNKSLAKLSYSTLHDFAATRHLPCQSGLDRSRRLAIVARFRAFFNNFNETPFLWSVDQGDISTEIKVRDWILIGATARTRVNLQADNVNDPKAWVEVEASELEIVNEIAILRG